MRRPRQISEGLTCWAAAAPPEALPPQVLWPGTESRNGLSRLSSSAAVLRLFEVVLFADEGVNGSSWSLSEPDDYEFAEQHLPERPCFRVCGAERAISQRVSPRILSSNILVLVRSSAEVIRLSLCLARAASWA